MVLVFGPEFRASLTCAWSGEILYETRNDRDNLSMQRSRPHISSETKARQPVLASEFMLDPFRLCAEDPGSVSVQYMCWSM